ncbi:unnamed protein product [Ranitomeya imitator]|uniref:Uncharacterized protein n=1 Tax=Ranitomeya imitator TaxID=111125 RepID=A0ABN9MCE6_9NEOB|nr:unnamed protein product [Ranitomeya imitator]
MRAHCWSPHQSKVSDLRSNWLYGGGRQSKMSHRRKEDRRRQSEEDESVTPGSSSSRHHHSDRKRRRSSSSGGTHTSQEIQKIKHVEILKMNQNLKTVFLICLAMNMPEISLHMLLPRDYGCLWAKKHSHIPLFKRKT